MKHKGLFLLFTILLTLFAASPVAAQQIQKFHVESFGENPFDMSAREKPTSRDDDSGLRLPLYAGALEQYSVLSAQNDSTTKLGPKTSAPYKIGDYYNDGTKEGIVYEISYGGYKGKIVSLEQNQCEWSEKEVDADEASSTDGMYNMQKMRSLQNWQNDYPAFAWCASLGEEWYLPALIELKAIYAQRSAINKALKAKGKPELENDWHWSSRQYDESCAWIIYMGDGYTTYDKKHCYNYVRAVSAFGSPKLDVITSAPYKIGDYYNDGTKVGIVFEISNGGYNGKILSLEENKCKWSEKNVKTGATSETDGMYNMQKIRLLRSWQKYYPAFAWCASLGEGWYLPALKEQKTIYARHKTIDNELKAIGKPEIKAYYWSSTQNNKRMAWSVYMFDLFTGYYDKYYDSYVRAVSAF